MEEATILNKLHNKRPILFALILLFIMSSCGSSQAWQLARIEGSTEPTARLKYTAQDTVNGADLVFVRIGSNLTAYLEVHGLPVPHYRDDVNTAIVSLRYQDEEISAIAFRHAGGQRIKLPLSLQNLLIKLLEDQTSVTLSVPGYRTNLDAKGFSGQFQKLYTSPLHNPFRLPFTT